MPFYNPQQLNWLQYAVKSAPQLLPQLYSQFNQVQPIDQGQTTQFANNARDSYLRNVTNPQVAQAAVAGGATDNSFAASMRAALAAQGAAQAQDVWNNAYNQQNVNQQALQSYNQNAADAAYGGFMKAYEPSIAKTAASRPSQFSQMGMQSPLSYLYGYRGMSPMQRLGSIGSGLIGGVPYAANALGFGGGMPGYPMYPGSPYPMYPSPSAPAGGLPNGVGENYTPNYGGTQPVSRMAPDSGPLAGGSGFDTSGFGLTNMPQSAPSAPMAPFAAGASREEDAGF